MTDTETIEALETLAKKWEENIEEIGELSGSHDIVGPIETSAWLLAVMQLRYTIEHNEVPDDDDLDAVKYTELPLREDTPNIEDMLSNLADQ